LHIRRKVMFSDYSSSGNNICITTLKDAYDIPKSPVISSSFLINRFDTLSFHLMIILHQYILQNLSENGSILSVSQLDAFYADIEEFSLILHQYGRDSL